MRYLQLAAVGFLFTFTAPDLALAGTTPPCPSSICYSEQGDAGDRSNPQNITGGPYSGIEGDIGGPTPPPKDQFDAFRFSFGGGNLLAIFTASVPIELRLFTNALVEIAPTLDDVLLETWNGLSPGNYILEVEALNDPPFQIGLFGPTLTPIGAPVTVAAVPEPDVGSLLLLGLVVLGTVGSRRSRLRRT